LENCTLSSVASISRSIRNTPSKREQQQEQQTQGEPGAITDEQLDRLSDTLDRLAERQRQGKQNAEDAERLRQRAEDLLKDASPEQRQRLADLAKRLQERRRQRNSDLPFSEELADLRGEPREAGDQQERVVGERPQEPGAEPPPAGFEGARSAERVREAAEGAQRALEQQVVPRRYRRAIREVFDRLGTGSGERSLDPVPPIGEDAKPRSGGGG
ncbi:MAG: hypothetical protein AAGI17_08070, partial [Planctomycetota bacterium]